MNAVVTRGGQSSQAHSFMQPLWSTLGALPEHVRARLVTPRCMRAIARAASKAVRLRNINSSDESASDDPPEPPAPPVSGTPPRRRRGLFNGSPAELAMASVAVSIIGMAGTHDASVLELRPARSGPMVAYACREFMTILRCEAHLLMTDTAVDGRIAIEHACRAFDTTWAALQDDVRFSVLVRVARLSRSPTGVLLIDPATGLAVCERLRALTTVPLLPANVGRANMNTLCHGLSTRRVVDIALAIGPVSTEEGKRLREQVYLEADGVLWVTVAAAQHVVTSPPPAQIADHYVPMRLVQEVTGRTRAVVARAMGVSAIADSYKGVVCVPFERAVAFARGCALRDCAIVPGIEYAIPTLATLFMGPPTVTAHAICAAAVTHGCIYTGEIYHPPARGRPRRAPRAETPTRKRCRTAVPEETVAREPIQTVEPVCNETRDTPGPLRQDELFLPPRRLTGGEVVTQAMLHEAYATLDGRVTLADVVGLL